MGICIVAEEGGQNLHLYLFIYLFIYIWNQLAIEASCTRREFTPIIGCFNHFA